jgi:hypothetical protein
MAHYLGDKPYDFAVVVFDGVIAIVYIFGMLRLTGVGFWRLMLGRST